MSTPIALCVNLPSGWPELLAELFQVHHVDSTADALRALRGIAIDLLVVSARVGDEPFWSFVDRVRRARPALAWILVGDVTDADEIRARCLGVLMVLDQPWPMTGGERGPGRGVHRLRSVLAGRRDP